MNVKRFLATAIVASSALLSGCVSTTHALPANPAEVGPSAIVSVLPPELQSLVARVPGAANICKIPAAKLPRKYTVVFAAGTLKANRFSSNPKLARWVTYRFVRSTPPPPRPTAPSSPLRLRSYLYYGTYSLKGGSSGCMYLFTTQSGKPFAPRSPYNAATLGAPNVAGENYRVIFMKNAPVIIRGTLSGSGGSGSIRLERFNNGRAASGSIRFLGRISVTAASMNSAMHAATSPLDARRLEPAAGSSGAAEFGYDGNVVQHYTVPAGVTRLAMQAVGATGGSDGSGSNAGGLGALASATFSVTPGEVFNILVGGQGGQGTSGNTSVPGGVGGGGTGDGGYGGDGSGSGGGASTIADANGNLYVAGGAGGGGGADGAGGQGGTPNGGNAAALSYSVPDTWAGTGATNSCPGSIAYGQLSGFCLSLNDPNPLSNGDGGYLAGGSGFAGGCFPTTTGTVCIEGGAGGGSGYYGGGAGGSGGVGAAGGGGASWIANSGTAVTYFIWSNSGNGFVYMIPQ